MTSRVAKHPTHKKGFMEGIVGFDGAKMRNGSPQSCCRSARNTGSYIITAKHNNRFVNSRCHCTGATINYDMTRHNKSVTHRHKTAVRHTDESGRVSSTPRLHRSWMWIGEQSRDAAGSDTSSASKAAP